MPNGVSKRANSADPRDWNYLKEWQRWGKYMPPWQYTFLARLDPPAPGFPLWDIPICFAKGTTTNNIEETIWTANVSIPSFDPPYTTTLFDFACSMVVWPPEVGALDPDGNPFTVSIAGYLEVDPLTRASWVGYFWKPPQLDVFNMIVRLPDYTPHPNYPFGIQMVPAIWNHLAWG